MNKEEKQHLKQHLIGLLNNAIDSVAGYIFDKSAPIDQISTDVKTLTEGLHNYRELRDENIKKLLSFLEIPTDLCEKIVSYNSNDFDKSDVGAFIIGLVAYVCSEDENLTSEQIKDLAESGFNKIFNHTIAQGGGEGQDNYPGQTTPPTTPRNQPISASSTTPFGVQMLTQEDLRLQRLLKLQQYFKDGDINKLIQALNESSTKQEDAPSSAPTDPMGQSSSSSQDLAPRP
jgi:hypothetical protein